MLARSLAAGLGWSTLTIDIMTPGAFESLGMGAWLACTMAQNPGTKPEASGVRLLGIAGLGLAGPEIALLGTLPGTWLSLTGTELWRSLLLTGLIAGAVSGGLPGWIERGLASVPAQALGLWSYAIYLSHNFIRCGVGACANGRLVATAEPFLALFLTLAWSAFVCRFADIIHFDDLQRFFSVQGLFVRQREVLRNIQPSPLREENRR